jgi:hypothetical protein
MAAAAARYSIVGFLAIYHTRSNQPFAEREEAYRQDIGTYYGPYFGF